MTVITNPADINAFALLALKGALKLESRGMKRRGPSALKQVQGLGIKARTAAEALPLFEAHLRNLGILV